jgi:acetoacetyl-CoA synthetase
VTLNGKKVELPVKHIVSGRKVEPSSSLANPWCLNFYYPFARDEVLLGSAGVEERARL